MAMVHAAHVESGSLVDMSSSLLSRCTIGAGSLIGAGALVTEGKDIPPGWLVMGSPGKVVRELDDEARARLLKSAEGYRANAARFRAGMTPTVGR